MKLEINLNEKINKIDNVYFNSVTHTAANNEMITRNVTIKADGIINTINVTMSDIETINKIVELFKTLIK